MEGITPVELPDSETGRVALYRVLSLLEDWQQDGFHQPGELPHFASLGDASPGDASPSKRQQQTATASASPPPGQAASQAPAQMAKLPINDSLEAINHEISRCLKCRLASSRNHTVPGQGTSHPVVLIIGEAPDIDDNAQGLPFSGPGGALLDKMLAAIRLQRTQHCYLTQVVKCFPPNGRDPGPDEQRCCAWYLERQIAVLQPQAILALGRIPAQLLLNSRESLAKLRGHIYDVGGRPCIISHSISNLLKDESLKRPAWEDLKLLLQILPNG
jgi:uracil-DNA glycosylase family 4